MEFIPFLAKLNFQQPLILSSVSHDSSEIIIICLFVAQETFLPMINIEKLKVFDG